MFGISNPGTISKIYKKYQLQGNVDNNYYGNSNAKKVVDDFEGKLNTLIQDFNSFKFSLSQIQEKLLEKYEVKISRQTVSNFMQKLEFKYGSARYVHALSDQNKLDRIQACRELKKLNDKKIIFSDEVIFSQAENGVKIWFQSNEDRSIKRKELQYYNRQVHAWACISKKGQSNIYFHNKTVDSEQYIHCIKETFLPFQKKYYKNSKCYLFQDGAPSHRSQQTKQYFDENGIVIFQNAPWSPDINPIELIWAHMKQLFKEINIQNQITTKAELIDVISNIWRNISEELINNTIDHVLEKLSQIIDKKGEYIV